MAAPIQRPEANPWRTRARAHAQDVEQFLHMAEHMAPVRVPRRGRPTHPVQPYSRPCASYCATGSGHAPRRRSKDTPHTPPARPSLNSDAPPLHHGQLRAQPSLSSSPSKAYDTMHRILRSAKAAPARGMPAHMSLPLPPSALPFPTSVTPASVSQSETHALSLTHGPDWRDLDGGPLMRVALLLPPHASAVLPIMQVCRAWRQVSRGMRVLMLLTTRS